MRFLIVQYEKLLLRLQEKDAQLTELTTENASMTSTLHGAESRLAELYADQSRMEEDIATRIEIAEKLRSQVRELEKEKREALRRYTEQSATFEAERQALYDNEQHLKSRIQSLATARKAQQEASERPASPVPSIAPSIALSEAPPISPVTPVARPPERDHDSQAVEASDGPEITALKLELSTLSTSHTSLQTMVQMLQTELTDLKRVNNELQEENESYGLLLMERAMNGTGVDMLRHMGGDGSSIRSETVSYGDARSIAEEGERSSLRSGARSMLDRVSEDEEFPEGDQSHQNEAQSLAFELQVEQPLEPPPSSRRRRTRPNSASSSSRGTPVGESLADLPITGPGLDLAAELGRAETKDILDGQPPALGADHSPSKSRFSRKVSGTGTELGHDGSEEVSALRQEVKSLKDANKALSLYASKIIDRIIMQEGFEHVLAVDYEPNKDANSPKSPGAFEEVLAKASPSKPKTRLQTTLLGRSSSMKANSNSSSNFFGFPVAGEPEKLTTFSDSPPSPAPDIKRNRRSLSLADWKFSGMFGASAPPLDKGKNLKQLTLRPGAGSSLVGARKLESQEDEEDRKERDRLNATMKLMGIEKPRDDSPAPLVVKTQSGPSAVNASGEASGTTVVPSNRFSSFFRSKQPLNHTSAAPSASSSAPPANLTSEALEQAEAESTLASLDAREKVLTAEIAKGGSGGFTELDTARRMSLGDQWRSRRTRSVSGKSHDSSGASTVWSAGMKGDEE